MKSDCLHAVQVDGYAIVVGVFSDAEVDEMTEALERALARPCEATSVRSRAGTVYAARNVLQLFPEAASLWKRAPLLQLLRDILGPDFGLVRVLYFDKPPEQSWSLPWHKDMTIAVRDNRLASTRFSKPTRKAGVPHVEAPVAILENMLTLRIHLDDVTPANGPMRVMPGSHAAGDVLTVDEAVVQSILARRGDVLLMRPLLAHSSVSSHPDTQAHRRILHLEFAASPHLPDAYEWHDFVPTSNN